MDDVKGKSIRQVLPVLLLAITFFALRLLYAVRFPLMEAEASDVRYGLLTVTQPSLLFASLRYAAKQPLAYWLFGGAAAVTHDFQVAPRIVSVLFGLVTLLFTTLTARLAGGKRVAFFTALTMTMLPLYVHFQGIALMESIILATTAGSLWTVFGYAKTQRSIYIVVLGIAGSIAFWTKTNAVIPCVLAFLLFICISAKRSKLQLKPFASLLIAPILFGISVIPLISQPNFSRVTNDVSIYTFSFAEVLRFPFPVWITNMFHVALSTVMYGGPFFLFAFAVGMFRSIRRYTLLLLFFAVGIFVIPVFFNKILSTRYYLPAYVPLAVIVAFGAEYIFQSRLTLFRVIGFLTFCISTSMSIVLITDARLFFRLFPPNSPLDSERGYALGWSSGYATRDAVAALNDERYIPRKAVITLQDFPGNPTDYIIAAYYFNPNRLTTLVNTAADLKNITQLKKNFPVYFVSRSNLYHEDLKPFMTNLYAFRSPDSDDFVEIYKIN